MQNYEELPASLVSGMRLYIEQGVQPGGFLTAVICNNLKESFMRADAFNQHLMFEIVKWMYNEAPSLCWGSPARMKHWIEQSGKEIHEPLPETS